MAAPADTAQGTANAISDDDLTRALTVNFFAVSHRMRQLSARRAADHDMSFTQVRALYQLRVPLSMRELADQLFLDPSNVTSLVDGLEAMGLVERTADADDRRIKRLVVTPKGVRISDTLVAAVFAESPVFTALTVPEQRELLHLLDRLVESPEP